MVYMFLANGFEETEAICPLDLLRRAGADVKTVAVGTDGGLVTGSHGIPVTADISESELGEADINAAEMVILPGGMPGANNLFASEKVRAAVTSAASRGAVVAAICAAPYILGQLDLLKGLKAVSYPGFEDMLTGATVVDAPVAVDKRGDATVVTARSAGAAMQFGLTLVSALFGESAADKVSSAVIYR